MKNIRIRSLVQKQLFIGAILFLELGFAASTGSSAGNTSCKVRDIPRHKNVCQTVYGFSIFGLSEIIQPQNNNCPLGAERPNGTPTTRTLASQELACPLGGSMSVKTFDSNTCKAVCPAETFRGTDGSELWTKVDECVEIWGPRTSNSYYNPAKYNSCDPIKGWVNMAALGLVATTGKWEKKGTDWAHSRVEIQTLRDPVDPTQKCRVNCANTCPQGYESLPKGDPRCPTTTADKCEADSSKVDEGGRAVCCKRITTQGDPTNTSSSSPSGISTTNPDTTTNEGASSTGIFSPKSLE